MTAHRVFSLLLLLLLSPLARAALPDPPFPQPVSHKFPLPQNLQGTAGKLRIDQDGIVYILTSGGVARLFGERIALDQSYRPLSRKNCSDIALASGRLYYLFQDEILSNRRAGKFVHKLATPFEQFAVNAREEVLLSDSQCLSLFQDGTLSKLDGCSGRPTALAAQDDFFVALAGTDVLRISGGSVQKLASGHAFTSLAFAPAGLVLGTTNGILIVDPNSGRPLLPLQTRLPSLQITSLASRGGDLWAGTTRGLWRRTADGSFRYFASKRWLDDDHVLDVQIDSNGSVFALTKTGLNKIAFPLMTLADKAAHYENKIRQRHIRYGFCAELRLTTPGDSASAEMIDTDNDGTWSNYYMASQAFHFAATGDETARRHAWETFEALERLESINPLGGFPSRTFERTGFKVSDPERWHARGDGIWDWKAHTSSDEIIAHAFGCAVLYECAATSAEEKDRIARFISKVLDHIIRHDWYLIDVDGKPTLWARWNPEYVNGFPLTIFDRRLNSAEIVGLLQFAHKITGNPLYKDKAFELLNQHGYLDNIVSPMTRIAFTSGHIHQGIELGTEWNHSDDLLAFVAYWVLHRFALNDDLRAKYAAAIRDHWEIEKIERCPLWNFVYASTGASAFDPDGALWTLRHFPLDMTDWSIANSHRQDITRKAPNFREQQLEELLPPDERRITRWNSQPFILDGGSGGHMELGGDEFLLPYWMGRYLQIIAAPATAPAATPDGPS